MAINDAMREKGYIPLVTGELIGIGWQGEALQDFWMWNGKFTEYEGGIKHICTVKVRELKEAAVHYWRDKWVPLRPIDGDLLRRMEGTLREHQGLKKEGVVFPDGIFLKPPEKISPEHMGPEVKVFLGMEEDAAVKNLARKGEISGGLLNAYRRHREA